MEIISHFKQYLWNNHPLPKLGQLSHKSYKPTNEKKISRENSKKKTRWKYLKFLYNFLWNSHSFMKKIQIYNSKVNPCLRDIFCLIATLNACNLKLSQLSQGSLFHPRPRPRETGDHNYTLILLSGDIRYIDLQ